MYSCFDSLFPFVYVFYSRHTVEQLEARYSDVRKELVTLKEALSQLSLQKEVLEDENRSLAQALSKVLLDIYLPDPFFIHLFTYPLIRSITLTHLVTY